MLFYLYNVKFVNVTYELVFYSGDSSSFSSLVYNKVYLFHLISSFPYCLFFSSCLLLLFCSHQRCFQYLIFLFAFLTQNLHISKSSNLHLLYHFIPQIQMCIRDSKYTAPSILQRTFFLTYATTLPLLLSLFKFRNRTSPLA